MTKPLSLLDPRVKQLRNHPLLVGLPLLGRGTFCAVFDRGDTVMKLTCDRITYEGYAGPVRMHGSHFPQLVENHGVLGETSGGLALYLFETEKLLKVDGRRHKEAREVTSILSWHRDFNQLVEAESLRPSIREAGAEMQRFYALFKDEGITKDLHYGNFMRRNDDTLIFNDAFCDGTLLSSDWSRTGQRLPIH